MSVRLSFAFVFIFTVAVNASDPHTLSSVVMANAKTNRVPRTLLPSMPPMVETTPDVIVCPHTVEGNRYLLAHSKVALATRDTFVRGGDVNFLKSLIVVDLYHDTKM